MTNDYFTIDASGKSLGRVASQAAAYLRGKHLRNFEPARASGAKITVSNVSKINFSAKKLDQKKYYRHSGFLGGQKVETARQIVQKKGYADILSRAIYGMLPKNRSRDKIIKNLTIKD